MSYEEFDSSVEADVYLIQMQALGMRGYVIRLRLNCFEVRTW